MKLEEVYKKFNSLNDFDKTNVYDTEDALGLNEEDLVAEHINRDEHRWYTIGTNVYKLEYGYLGVRGPNIRKSEEMSWSDIGLPTEVIEHVEKVTVTYVPKL